MNKFTGLVRRCIEDYEMIEEGDRIAVGVSGGKDSIALLCALANLREYYPKQFRLSAITVDIGFENMDFSEIQELCHRLKVPYSIAKTNIKSVVFDNRIEKNPCSLCSKMRKGVLNENIKEAGFTKLALGHHKDDAVETFFMSLIYENRIHCFQPVTFLDRSGITQIRPLMYTTEEEVINLNRRYILPIVKSTCPMNGKSVRHSVKELLEELTSHYPDLPNGVFKAMQRYPLKGFSPSPHPKRKSLNNSKSSHVCFTPDKFND